MSVRPPGHVHLPGHGMPDIRCGGTGHARLVDAGFLEEAHRRHQPAITTPPHANALSVHVGQGLQKLETAVQILNVDAPVIPNQGFPKRATVADAPPRVDLKDDVASFEDEILLDQTIEAAEYLFISPSLPHRIGIDRPENDGMLLRLIQVGRLQETTMERHAVEMTLEGDVPRLDPVVLRELRRRGIRDAALRGTAFGVGDVELRWRHVVRVEERHF